MLCGYEVQIDEEDYENISRYKWYTNYTNKYKYFCAYLYIQNGKRKNILLHRFIMNCVEGDGITIDHINGDTLDNRKQNLRRCTSKDNCRNSKKAKNNTSGYKGVSKELVGFTARIRHNGAVRHIGRANTAIECARMYDMMAIKLYGEFASTNFDKREYTSEMIEIAYNKFISILPQNNTSGYRGVSYDKSHDCWVAYIIINKHRTNVGYYRTAKKAAIERDSLIHKKYEGLATLNFPKGYKE